MFIPLPWTKYRHKRKIKINSIYLFQVLEKKKKNTKEDCVCFDLVKLAQYTFGKKSKI